MKTFFITGTGTGVGKTLFTGLMARLATARGLRAAVMKPVQTGVAGIDEGDIGTVRRLAPGIIPLPDELACPYMLKFEASPHLAAQEEGVEIDVERIKESAEKIAKDYKPDILLLEGAGGVCVPLGKTLMNTGLMACVGAPAIVVATAGLGTINHTVLTLKELRTCGIPIAGVAINLMPAKPGKIELDNLKMIGQMGNAEILSIIRQEPNLEGSGFESCEGLIGILR